MSRHTHHMIPQNKTTTSIAHRTPDIVSYTQQPKYSIWKRNAKMPNPDLFSKLLKLLDTTSVEYLLHSLVKILVQDINPADAGMVFLYNTPKRQLVSQASHGYTESNETFSLSSGEGAPWKCYSSRKPLVITSTKAAAADMSTMRTSNLERFAKMRRGLPPIQSMVAIPIKHKNRTSGVILLEHSNAEETNFTEANLLQLEELSSLIWFIIEYVQASLELKDMKRSYRNLLGRFIATSEEERKRIAREIHDEVNQLLLSVRLNLEDMENSLPSEKIELRKRLEIIRSYINRAFDDLHTLSLSLRPPAMDELGLPQALDWYIQNLSKEAGLPITLQTTGMGQRRPAPVIEMELFRLAQEALSNIIKHAQATAAKIKLEYTRSQLILLVEDNGKGFDVNAVLGTSTSVRNLGLLGIRERAEMCGGTLDISSSIGKGTKIKVEVPLSSYDWGAY